ncbi:MAG: hypothetical protein K2M06_04045 [Muribaculaceae bacterium]|nr:hypothetical protein [Muribaculaceae bacterium]
MISLAQYREYWQGVAGRIDGLTDVLPVTVDKSMGDKIKALPKGSTSLFILPPGAEGSGGIDSFREKNMCVVFLMAKYDPQRKTAFELLEETQPLIEKVKAVMLADQAAGCPVMRVEASSIDTMPETELYGTFAGWSISFTVK